MAPPDGYKFPGMDPWLEHPLVWPGVHHYLITYLADDLAARLRPRYVVRPGEREVIEVLHRAIVPDVVVSRPKTARPSVESTAILEPASPIVVRLSPTQATEGYLEIRDLGSGGKVVTAIEILSPSNKRAGTDSRAKYVQEQSEILRSETHRVEIDLLRAGALTVACPSDVLEMLAPHDYRVVVRRATRREEVEIYPVRLEEQLPSVSIPLAPDDRDTSADLQSILIRAYESGGYDLDLDYSGQPIPPLSPERWEWARSVVDGT